MKLARAETTYGPTPKFILRKQGHVAQLAFNRPSKHNAIDLEMWRALPECIALLTSDPAVRVLCLRGEGGTAFCAGADILEFSTLRSQPEEAAVYETMNVMAFQSIKKAAIPTLALVEGYCIGAGAGLAVACDLRIANSSARFALPAGKLGLAYPAETIGHFVDVIGPAATKDLVYTGRQLGGREALEIGLVNRMFDDEHFDQAAFYFACTICEQAPLSLQAAKHAVDAAMGVNTSVALAAKFARGTLESQDYHEGIRAFIEKREPSFDRE